MASSKMKRIVATVVATGTFGFACSGVALAADTGGSGTQVPGTAAGQATPGRHPRLRLLRAGLRVSAEAIGVPVKDLVAGLRSGQTIEQFAQSKGVDPAKVKAALEKAANDAIDAGLGRGVITEERAEKLKSHVSERVDKFMTRSWPHLAGQAGPRAS
jgi:hypothetical protein